MVVYYINKVSENLADYPYPIKEGDICMLYDGEIVKTVYIDSERDSDSIWRDFKFIDTKSLRSYHFPKEDCILCAPVGERRALGDANLLTQLIQDCKGEWLLDFLNETSAVLSGFVDYWDLVIIKRLIGYDDVDVVYANEEDISEFVVKPEETKVEEDEDDVSFEEDDDVDFLPKNYDVRWFCLSALSCIEDLLDKRSYAILEATQKGKSRKDIADEHSLTQERIRQIVVKATKQAKELLVEQRKSLEETKAENARLKVQLDLLKEDAVRLKALLPKEVLLRQKNGEGNLDEDMITLLETPIKDIRLSVRASNILTYMGVKKFSDIPQIESAVKLLKMRNSGQKTVNEISRLLDDFKLTFGMSFADLIDSLTTNDCGTAKRRWIKVNYDDTSVNKIGYEGGEDIIPEQYANATENDCDGLEEVTPKEATVTLTREIIEASRTPNGGFTRSQLAAIGIDWPPPQDWVEEKVGTMITPAQLEAFNHIEYVSKLSTKSFQGIGSRTYKDIAFNSEDRRKMEAVLQAMTHFIVPATPRDIARTISRTAWGSDVVHEDTVDSFLKRLPEVDYVQWGKYILKNRNK